ncbi:hypothetical protein [Nocardioides sp.]|uniref:hypothetical protein n=1 Tax=Nocardioides sp. TaxID=35761 RepID=UPI0035198389
MLLRRPLVLAVLLLAFVCSACSTVPETSADTRKAARSDTASASEEAETGLILTEGTRSNRLSRALAPSNQRTVKTLTKAYSPEVAALVLERSDAYLKDVYLKQDRFDYSSRYALPQSDLDAIADVTSPASYARFLAAARRLDAYATDTFEAFEKWTASGRSEADFVPPAAPKTAGEDLGTLGGFIALPGDGPVTYLQKKVTVYEPEGDPRWRGQIVVHYELLGGAPQHRLDYYMGWKAIDGALKFAAEYWELKDLDS